jgi:hypothetical protein
MKRNEAIELLEKYNQHLMEEGYADTDLFAEQPTAIDSFFGTKWAKENVSLVPSNFMFKVGDKIVVDNDLHTEIFSIRDNKYWFKDNEGKTWHLDCEDTDSVALDTDNPQ